FSQQLEGLGYYSIGFPDHFFIGHTDPFAPAEPFTSMGYAAASTTTLRIVCIVACNDFRHPALFARSMASLDVLSDGRVEAGIGAGWYGPEFEAIGMAFDRPGVRIERLEEAIQIIKGMWTGTELTFDGKHYQVKGLPCIPKPVQQPHPPILIGAGGDKMLALAGRHADVVGLTSSLRDFDDRDAMRREMQPESVQRKVDIVRRSAVAAGRDPKSLTLQCQINTIDFDGEDPGHLWAIAGDPARMIDVLQERAAMGITYFMFRERNRDLLREFGEKVISKL
ncbi:MAG: LLM class flavin-dependent oxidoreductase, partial [Actinomycetota bacterium]